jgi:predicted alpha/beta superfamily hydrolase
MRRRISAFLALGVLLGATGLPAQTAVTGAISWTRHTIQSSTLGAEREYLVALPQSYAAGGNAYPVLLLLDADDQPQFVAALANIRFLASRNEIPELIVVGIPNAADRTHDLAPPTNDPGEQKLFPTAGGGAAFATYLTAEVLPAVRASYRTLPATFLAGHSFGGLMALHTATALPDVFRGAIAMSPSLQWSRGEYATTYADALAKRTGSYRLFVTSGGLEPDLDASTRRMMARLDSVKTRGRIAVGYQRYTDDTHGLTPVPSLVDGLRYIFEPMSLRQVTGEIAAMPRTADSTTIVTPLRKAEERWVEGARAMGLPTKIPEDFYNMYGYLALQWLNNHGAAVALFRRNVELYPESANVYDSLGDALLAKGDKTGARAQFARAVEIGEKTGHPVLPESRRKLEALKH